MKIAFFGGTGMIGTPMAHELIHRGHQVIFFGRNASKVAELHGSDAPFRETDLTSANTLTPLLKDIDAIVICLSVEAGSKESAFQAEREGLSSIIQAAQVSRVQHLHYLSSIVHRYRWSDGRDWWVFKLKRQAVDAIKHSGIPYTVYYPSSFMECFVSETRGYLMGKLIVLPGQSQAPQAYISARDFGLMLDRSLALEPTISREFFILGPEAHLVHDGARLFANAAGGGRYTVKTIPAWPIRMFGLFSARYRYVDRMVDATNNHPEPVADAATEQFLGRATETLEVFAKRQHQKDELGQDSAT